MGTHDFGTGTRATLRLRARAPRWQPSMACVLLLQGAVACSPEPGRNGGADAGSLGGASTVSGPASSVSSGGGANGSTTAAVTSGSVGAGGVGGASATGVSVSSGWSAISSSSSSTHASGAVGMIANSAATTGAVDEPRPTVTAEPGTVLVRVDPGVRYQAFEGWGTSLCWWANHVGGWSAEARDAVVEAVVDPVAGLGYNIFRYNIGGGENPAHEHMDQHREMPGFQNSDGSWAWESDANQRAILLSIAERGSDVIFEAFSNSPPYWMTVSGCASGSDNGANNLKPDAYGDFADYLTEVVLHYRDEYGIVFRTLEPLNEPYADWWRANGSQEGCHFDPSSQEALLLQVAAELADKGLTGTSLSAADENSMDDALMNLRSFDASTVALLGQLNVHSYAGTLRAELYELAASLGLRLWQSESGPLGQDISDDTEAALFMAGRIIEDLRELKPVAWLDWQSGDPSRSWASFTLNDAQQSYAPLKRFYMHAGFSRYIRPGATFVEVDHPDMVAAVSPGESALTLVIRNADPSTSKGFTFDLTALPTVAVSGELYRTSRTEDLELQPPVDIEAYRVVLDVPAYSVSTFVIPMP